MVAAIGNVPVFLFALFILQTRFRPELQEDLFYSFAPRLPFPEMLHFLKLALEMKFVGYSYVDNEEDIEEDVLIGSYGNIQIKITGEMETLLASAPEPVDLRIYEEQHRVRI